MFKNSLKIKNLKLKIVVSSLLLCFGIIAAQEAQALTMSGTNYILQMGTINSGSGRPTGPNYKLGITLGQIAPGLYAGTNYKVRSGFQYIKSIIYFAFSITQTQIDFGTLNATNPVTRASDLIVSNGSASGYSVTASQNSQLMNAASGAIIPNTTCDNGTCTTTTSDTWSSTLTYGFGYRCDNVTGTDCASGFSDAANYKQFAASPSAVAVMTGTNVGRSKRVTITYKVNISGTQAAGAYNNRIMYIATPTF